MVETWAPWKAVLKVNMWAGPRADMKALTRAEKTEQKSAGHLVDATAERWDLMWENWTADHSAEKRESHWVAQTAAQSGNR